MKRRDFLQAAAVGAVALGAAEAIAGEKYFPSKVDPKLFDAINRVKDPANKTPLEKKHAPVIKAPEVVKAGEPFAVEVSVGEMLHDMGPAHWIEWIELNIGNEPAGRVDFQPKGYLRPRATFLVVLGQEFLAAGKATLVANERCNLHGYWEASLDIKVS
ncbi:MAG: class II SORL domain-containing protein [Nitrospirae bacterium]|nr:class II SORL domain-containing protein [Nitrospirota bacterium]